MDVEYGLEESCPQGSVARMGRKVARRSDGFLWATFRGGSCGGLLWRSCGRCADPLTQVFDAIGEACRQRDPHAQLFAQCHGEFVQLEGEAFVGFKGFGRVAAEQVPDLHQ